MPGYVDRTPAANADLREIADYIGVQSRSPVAAHKFLDEFEEKCLTYANQPKMGEPRPELGDELRSFLRSRKTTLSSIGRMETVSKSSE